MNVIFIAFGTIIIFVSAYRFYGKSLRRHFDVIKERKTPYYHMLAFQYEQNNNIMLLITLSAFTIQVYNFILFIIKRRKNSGTFLIF